MNCETGDIALTLVWLNVMGKMLFKRIIIIKDNIKPRRDEQGTGRYKYEKD